MKLPLELSCCIVDLDEVAYIVYHLTLVPVSQIVTVDQFNARPLGERQLTVALRGGKTFTLFSEDAAVFVSVFRKQVKEWINEQILVWQKGFEENKDAT